MKLQLFLTILLAILLPCIWILTNTDSGTETCNAEDETCQASYAEPTSAEAIHTNDDESCKDTNKNCQYWAEVGECNKNPSYMLQYCAHSCNSCNMHKQSEKPKHKKKKKKKLKQTNVKTVDETASRGGRSVKYQYGDPDDVMDIDLNELDTSMCPTQFPNCTACKDISEHCSFFERKGECDKHPGWMVMNCGQTCKYCHLHDYYTRCINPQSSPMNEEHQTNSKVFDKSGDLNEFFINLLRHYVVHRFVLRDIDWIYEVLAKPGMISIKEIINNIENEYDTQILRENEDTEDSELLDKLLNVESEENRNLKTKDGPWIVLFDNYMTQEESLGIIEAAPEFQRSTDVGKKDASGHFQQITSKSRTSLNSWCQTECWNHPMVQQVMTRVETLFNISMDNTEHLQILEYSPGQYYKTHHDYIGQQIGMPCGPRIMTFYMYLSDVESGGETAFPKIGIAVKPKLGRAILWPSVRNDAPDQIDSRTYHEARPVINGVKYGANSWFHLFDFQTPNVWSCTG